MIVIVLGLMAISFVGTYCATRRSFEFGLISLLTIGYFYGILRANLLNPFSHFIFDAGLIAFYISFPWTPRNSGERLLMKSPIQIWTWILMGWPIVMAFVPLQPILVTIVGLRSALLFLPMLVVGSRLRSEHLTRIASAIAVLNLIAVGFGIAEYQFGLLGFYPFSPVTEIMYRSVDGAGNYRIPAIFTSAHAYGGMMVSTIPLLLNSWMKSTTGRYKLIMLLGLVAGMTGVLFSSTRLNFVIGTTMVVLTMLTSPLGFAKRAIWIGLLIIAGCFVVTNDRFSRFKQLDNNTVQDRVAGSVNKSFLEVLYEYPIGNGLGGGGTSMPYFLQGLIVHPVVIENEYAHILLEQGVLGLMLWIVFILWYAVQRTPFAPGEWRIARRLYWFLYLFSFMSASIGVGLLTSIPESFMILLMIGWITSQPAARVQSGSTSTGELPLDYRFEKRQQELAAWPGVSRGTLESVVPV
jgi:hypothetical protein